MLHFVRLKKGVIMKNDALEQAIINALRAEGKSQEANKAYLEFIKANFLVPIEKNETEDEPKVLYLEENEETFLPVFSNRDALEQWAQPIADKISLLTLSGVDLLKGIGDHVTVCLNIGSAHFKAFNPQEIARMKGIVLKFFKN